MRATSTDVEPLEQRPGPAHERLGKEPAEPRVRLSVEVVERDVLGEREVQDEPAAVAVLGNMADSEVDDLSGACTRHVARRDDDSARRSLAEPGKDLDELGLPVAVDAGDADDLAGPDRERDAAHPLQVAVVQRVEVIDFEQRLSGCRRALLDTEQHLAPHHHSRQPFLRGALAWHGVDFFAAAQHGDAICDLEYLVELVADEDHGHALAREQTEDLEELDRLLRREHGGGLVEDEDVRSPVERLQDLHPLLLADADVLHPRVRVDGEAERPREL